MELYKGDCLKVMKNIESVDMILCDLPYGVTSQRWDSVIPLDKLWNEYKRIIKPKGAIVLFATEPFATKLRMSNLEWYRYDWIWNKGRPSNFQLMNYQPGRVHELICVFSSGKACYTSNDNSMIYYPQKEKRETPVRNGGGLKTCRLLHKQNMDNQRNLYTDKHPTTILSFNPPHKKIHPTEKPTDLLEFLIRTYTDEGDTVLDNCMGSGSTGIACLNTGREFIGIELNGEYHEIATKRIKEHQQQLKFEI